MGHPNFNGAATRTAIRTLDAPLAVKQLGALRQKVIDVELEAGEIFKELGQSDGLAADRWFASLDGDWDGYDIMVYYALKRIEVLEADKLPSSDLRFAVACAFPPC